MFDTHTLLCYWDLHVHIIMMIIIHIIYYSIIKYKQYYHSYRAVQ